MIIIIIIIIIIIDFKETHLNALRFIKEGGVDAVKIEGGGTARVDTITKLVDGGIAVMGHIGR